ncbi:hypothetical protein [Spirochaeta lutea]|uniref:DUF4321 domain-containing protein n=1 Tax=Spirochaeta lutea TaxID=1480694 RepID=A0A098R2A5_9SPIO|nr:hypothetical protein [Spirochaeta lutea]KGE73793.1 hypothetical protein DC28_00790 [Spirochaeta lutea]
MKLTQKNWNILARFLFLGLIAGTLAWQLVELGIQAAGSSFSLTAGPIGFSLGFLEISMMVNPGSFLGLASGFLLFLRA